jgi:hypothetical protein
MKGYYQNAGKKIKIEKARLLMEITQLTEGLGQEPL